MVRPVKEFQLCQASFLASQLRKLGDCWAKPYNPLLVTNGSFKSSPFPSRASSKPSAIGGQDELPSTPTSLYLFPSFDYVTLPTPVDLTSYSSTLDILARKHFHNNVPADTDSTHDIHGTLTRSDTNPKSIPVREVVVLICGHGGRDSRCGALGLPLQAEFEQKLSKHNIGHLSQERPLESDRIAHIGSRSAHVGLISHIGGHKWAGNVIIYIPPSWQNMKEKDSMHPLSGSAIWYGRVEPRHVEGIVAETIVNGRIIKELWRGGMQRNSAENSASTWDTIQGPPS